MPSFPFVDECADELILAELEREIARETEAIADFGRRTRVLEAEVAGWHSRPASWRVQNWTGFERFLSVLGSILGFFLAFFPAILAFGLIAYAVGIFL